MKDAFAEDSVGAEPHHLSVEECWERLEQQTLGRLVTHAADEIDIFPVNYAVENKTLLVKTAPGTKLLELTIHPEVVFEIDYVTPPLAYSVVVKGTASELQRSDEIEEAERRGPLGLLPQLRYRWVRITPISLTGIAFEPAVS